MFHPINIYHFFSGFYTFMNSKKLKKVNSDLQCFIKYTTSDSEAPMVSAEFVDGSKLSIDSNYFTHI